MGRDRVQLFETFVRVVEAGSLSAAAAQLGTSLSSVSRALAELERLVGEPLVDRTARAFRVTAAGERLQPKARAVLQAVDDASIATAPRVLRVSVPVPLGLTRVMPSLPALYARAADLELELLLEDRPVALDREGIDVVVRAGRPSLPESGELVARSVGRYPYVLCGSPALLKRTGVPREPGELARWPLIAHHSLRGQAGVPFHRGRTAVVVPVAARLWTNDLLAMHQATRDGVGLAALPDWLVEADLAQGTLRAVLPDWRSPMGEAWVAYRRRGRGLAQLRLVVDHLASALAFTRP
ncbi:MAG: LysR family transcriptional regulator [Kofleriaceae bacterium]